MLKIDKRITINIWDRNKCKMISIFAIEEKPKNYNYESYTIYLSHIMYNYNSGLQSVGTQ